MKIVAALIPSVVTLVGFVALVRALMRLDRKPKADSDEDIGPGG